MLPQQNDVLSVQKPPFRIAVGIHLSEESAIRRSDYPSVVAQCRSAGINRHVGGDERALQERRKRIHLGPESCGQHQAYTTLLSADVSPNLMPKTVATNENDFKMASETITAGLKKYGIGSKLRRLRLRKSMGLVELSKHTGLSPALLSKLERDLMQPTLPTLLRIEMVFSVGLEYFFNPESTPVLEIVRKKDRLRFPDSPDGKQAAYYFESLDFPVPDRALHSYLAEFEPTKAEHIKLRQHPEIEFLYVLSGRLELRTGEDTHELADGDAIYFDCTVPHGYRKLASKRTRALVVVLERRA
jgi:transcriptional regulator with XRE-family HTH domain